MRSRRAGARSSAVPLALIWWAVIVYASLFPFEGWRWPAGADAAELLSLPWPHYFITFDITSNLLGYLPLGLLVALARLRHGAGPGAALLGALALGAGTAYAMELAQQGLPQRVPSLLDWLLNSAGTLLGALLAVAGHRLGVLRRWQAARERWIGQGHGGALALLLLWPAALLFPTPVPLGLGQVGAVVQGWLAEGLADVPWAEPALQWLVSVPAASAPLSAAGEQLATALGLLAPCLLAFAVSPRGWRRAGLVAAALVLGLGATTLSTALNFGPDHAWAWRTPATDRALAGGVLVALALLATGPRLAAALALVVLTGLALLVHQAPTDPYYALSLQGWEQGQFIRFHGLAQWLGWLWPYAAMAWLLARLGAAEPATAAGRRGAAYNPRR